MPWYRSTSVVLSLYILSCLSAAEAEVFTALVEMKPLIQTEEEIAKTLEKYLELEEQRLENVRRLKSEYERLHEAATGNTETFLSNPLNAYVLLKRLTTDWIAAVRSIEGANSIAVFANLTKEKRVFPSAEDLKGSATAIFRLQDTYLLDTSKLAQGELEGSLRSLPLTAADCYELGYHAHHLKDHFNSALWLQEAYNRLGENEVKTVNTSTILEPMAYSTFMLGFISHAVELVQELLKHDPKHPRAHHHLAYYKAHLTQDELQKRQEIDRNDTVSFDFHKPIVERRGYESLCRGETLKTPKEESQLYCRYTSSNSKYLLLQPVKQEVLSLDPFLALYYDVISNSDIEIIKNLSQPRLTRATVHNPKTGAMETATFRVSKSAWLFDKDHPRIARSSRMIEEILDLESDTAEELQIVNYGMGGHYEPHFDFRREEEIPGHVESRTGNRIATWIYYLSDVEAGGVTAFPLASAGVRPKKGAAAFWYNLYKSGKGDMRTIHGGCPVLAGSKWVANKWFHEYGQEFRRRCSKNPNE